MKTRLYAFNLLAACLGSVVLAGCTVRVGALYPGDILDVDTKDQIPIHTALLIPEGVRDYVWKGSSTSAPLGGHTKIILPLGAGLESAARQACTAAFRQCRLLRTAPDAGRFDLVIEPAVAAYEIRTARGGGYGWWVVGVGKINVKFHEKGSLALEKEYTATSSGEAGRNMADE